MNPIIAEAVNAAVQALVVRLAENAGDRVSQAIFGNENNDFEVEVVERLWRLEQKLDDISRFLREALPILIGEKVTDGFIFDSKSQLHALTVAISSARDGLAAENTQQAANHLLDVGDEILALGLRLLGYGQSCYICGIQAINAGLSAYAILLERGDVSIDRLASWARNYRDIMMPWIDPGVNNSFESVRRSLKENLDEFNKIESNPPTVEFVAHLIRYDFYSDAPIGAPREIVSVKWEAESAVLHNFDGDGRWGDGGFYRKFHVMRGPGDPVPYGDFGIPVLSWWEPPVNTDFNQVMSRLREKAYIYKHGVIVTPMRIDECSVAISSISSLIRSCDLVISAFN